MGSTVNKKKKQKGTLRDYVSWFEIPSMDFQRAVDFYNLLYGIEMETSKSLEVSMAFFPADGGIGGAIVSGPGSVPHSNGPLIYLNAGNDLNDMLTKVEQAGGRIILPKTIISEEAGYYAIFIDCEGNKLAFHSIH
jgi:uncharacterized protein